MLQSQLRRRVALIGLPWLNSSVAGRLAAVIKTAGAKWVFLSITGLLTLSFSSIPTKLILNYRKAEATRIEAEISVLSIDSTDPETRDSLASVRG